MSPQLEALEQQRKNLINQIKSGISLKSRRQNEAAIKELEDRMAKLNKLDDDERNINSVWIGIPPKGEFDNLKLWAKHNPKHKIHIWTDSTHILTHKLCSIISKESKITNNGSLNHDYNLEANLKDEFYYNYRLKNPEKTFDENVKQFLIDKKYATETEVSSWIEEGKRRIIEEKNAIQEYTKNEVILHDVHEEWKTIFPSREYYNGYLKTLEHLHIAAGGSDRIRYAVLNKFGGVYLDTDAMVVFNLTKIRENEKIVELVKSIKWDEEDKSFNRQNKKFEIILNEIILMHSLDKLNDENLKEFTLKWEKIFKGKFDENIKIFEEIVQEFKNMNLNLAVTMKLSNFPINNSLGTIAYEKPNHKLYNAFIISKKNSKLLQTIMNKIEKTDEELEKMATYTKLINKNTMVLYHTGPSVLYYTTMEQVENYFFQHTINSASIIELSNINSFDTSWYCTEKHEDSIKDVTEMRRAFLDHSNKFKVPNYTGRPEIKTILKKIEDQNATEEEASKIWEDPSLWFDLPEEFNEIYEETELEETSLLEDDERFSSSEETAEKQNGHFSNFLATLHTREQEESFEKTH